MKLFIPDIAYVDPKVLKIGSVNKTIKFIENLKIPIIKSRKVIIEGKTPAEIYAKAKKTIYITTNSQKKLRPCKPSADFQFSLSSSCPGHCEYCYLQTTQGDKPYLKVYVNIDEILNVLKDHINNNLPNITSFESGSITDPVALEHLTGNLKKCIEFFAENENGRLRVITKYDNVDSFLSIKHNNHTKFRFSINTEYVINTFEHGTSNLEERLEAAKKIVGAGYPIGFIIAPIMIYNEWKTDYQELLNKLKSKLTDYNNKISFELIQHRFTNTAKELILSRFPNTKLDLNEENRILKWGPYGKFKHVYPKEKSYEMKEYITRLINNNFTNAEIEYFT